VGLFDKVVKQGLGNALGSKVTDAIEQATGIDINQDGRIGAQSAYGSTAGAVPAPGQQAAYQAAPAGIPVNQITDKAYFRAIISECFSEYIVREDVPVEELGGQGKPFDFMLIANGDCAGVVMLVEHNRDNNRLYKGARYAAQAAGVPFINCYTHMLNERGYVINRIKRLAKPATPPLAP